MTPMVVAAILFAVTVLSMTAILASPVTLTLERSFPSNHGIELSQLRARDSVRHHRMLPNHVLNFPVRGEPTDDGSVSLMKLYYTKVRLGSPPREFNVQIDTGSDALWVSCASCNGCPQTTELPIQLNYFDPRSSSTSSLVSCSDKKCRNGVGSSCKSRNKPCTYTFKYGDGSGSSGYYVSDLMHFASISEGAFLQNSSARVVFGCSNLQMGELTDFQIDGIFGFGQHGMSVISQLTSQGIASGVFSHCLKGDSSGGGKLVLGEIVEPNIIYSPLVPSQPHYNLNLQTISVNGQILPINSAVFATSSSREVPNSTIIDSGTTLAYLAEEAYYPFVHAITAAIPQSVRTVGAQCYLTPTSNIEIFPQISLNFAGGASLVVTPRDYLIQKSYIGNGSLWCLGFQNSLPGMEGLTVLGDIVLKDKIVVYDLPRQRIGWATYDCSLPVNVTASTGTGQLSGSTSIFVLFIHITVLFFTMY